MMMKIAILVLVTLFAISQAVPNCNDYCGNITANCNLTNAQYTNLAHCVAMCGAFPVGTDNDTSGNTLGCRAYHAGAALSTGDLTHCFHAGPSGVNVANNAATCGTECEAYCSIMTHTTGCIANLRGFNTLAECTKVCSLFPSDASKFYDNATGNSLQCRIYHAKVAFSSGQTTLDTHCQHAHPLGGGQCGEPVDNYCTIIQGVCTGTEKQYPDATYCKSVAANFPNTSYYNYDMDTLACRAYHSVVGGEGGAKAIHCFHGGASGNGTGGCGDICDNFCQLSGKLCPTNYADNAACKTACGAWTSKLGNAPTDTDGDSFYCRLYHLGAASINATLHCPHALANSATCSSSVTSTDVSSSTDQNTPGPATTGSGVILGFSVLALIANLF